MIRSEKWKKIDVLEIGGYPEIIVGRFMCFIITFFYIRCVLCYVYMLLDEEGTYFWGASRVMN